MSIETMINILKAFKRYIDYMNNKGHDETIRNIEVCNDSEKTRAFGENESLIITMCGHMGETYKLKVYISSYSNELCIMSNGVHLLEQKFFIDVYGLTKDEWNYIILGK